jgi:hypothetical protein
MNNVYNDFSKNKVHYRNNNKNSVALREKSISGLEMLLCAIDNIILLITSKNFLTVLKVLICVACFFGFIGIVGGIDKGSISLGQGIVYSLLAIFIELICFRK